MDRNILIVGIGGFLGSICRYLVAVLSASYVTPGFPFATFAVNIGGCFLIGILFALSEKGNVLAPELRVFLTTGFCGGFTTFSTFSYESIKLLQGGEFLYVALNIVLSVLIGFAATYIGILIVKSL